MVNLILKPHTIATKSILGQQRQVLKSLLKQKPLVINSHRIKTITNNINDYFNVFMTFKTL